MAHAWVWCTIGDGIELCICQKCGTQYTEKRHNEKCNSSRGTTTVNTGSSGQSGSSVRE